MKKTVALIIMDGFGVSNSEIGNAIKSAETPNIDKYLKDYPSTLINASGRSVGLPEGQCHQGHGRKAAGADDAGTDRRIYCCFGGSGDHSV